MLRLMPLVTAAGLMPLGARAVRHQIGELSLKVWQAGPADGEPWILLHGLGSTALSWRAPLVALRSDCRLLVPELSAHGGSRGPGAGLGVGDGVAAVLALAERAFPGRSVNLAGISLGAWIAVRAALAAPERVGSLLLVAAAGYRDQDWRQVGELVTIRTLADVDRFYRAMFVRPPFLLRAGRRAFLAAYSSPAVRDALARTGEEDLYGDAELARLEQPVSLVWGESDGLFGLEVARKMAAALPRARLEVLPDCAHGLQWERPSLLAAAVRRLSSTMTGPAAVAAGETRWTLRNT